MGDKTKIDWADASWNPVITKHRFRNWRISTEYPKKTIQNAINGITWKCVQYMPEPPKEEPT